LSLLLLPEPPPSNKAKGEGGVRDTPLRGARKFRVQEPPRLTVLP